MRPVSFDHSAPVRGSVSSPVALATVRDSTNRRMPSRPLRRPSPDRFIPPIGASTLEKVAR